MKEKILKQIKDYSDQAIKVNGRRVLIDHNFGIVAQKIDTLTKEHYMLFISWLRVYCVGVSSKTWLFTDDQNITLNLTDEQAYQYWLDNIISSNN
jgi:hypothetical protein